jgi:hypothetical protein
MAKRDSECMGETKKKEKEAEECVEMRHRKICIMLRRKGSSTDAKLTHVQEKEDSILNEYNVLFDN